MISAQVRGADDMRRMAQALRRADRVDLRADLVGEIRGSAEPARRDVEQAALHIRTRGLPVSGRRRPFDSRRLRTPHHLRRQIASAVTTSVRLSETSPRLSIRVSGRRLPPSKRSMPRKLDNGRTFRHPVMGHRQTWAAQTSQGWFWPPIRKRLYIMRQELSRILDRLITRLESTP